MEKSCKQTEKLSTKSVEQAVKNVTEEEERSRNGTIQEARHMSTGGHMSTDGGKSTVGLTFTGGTTKLKLINNAVGIGCH